MALQALQKDVVLTSSAAIALHAVANSVITVVKATVVNYDTVPRLLTVWRMTVTGAPSNANLVIDQQSISANETQVTVLSGFFLANGGVLYAKADVGSKLNLSLSYNQASQTP